MAQTNQAPPAADDAELIRLCAEQYTNIAAINADAADIEDDNPQWLALKAAEAAIDGLPPQTIAGVVAKARLAKLIALEEGEAEVGDEENWDGTDAGSLARKVVNDLVRIADGQGMSRPFRWPAPTHIRGKPVPDPFTHWPPFLPPEEPPPKPPKPE